MNELFLWLSGFFAGVAAMSFAVGLVKREKTEQVEETP